MQTHLIQTKTLLTYRQLTTEDCTTFYSDIVKCYRDNPLIFDSQNPLRQMTEGELVTFISNYIKSEDSLVIGIFNSKQDILFGVAIFDSIRFSGKDSCAQVHIAISKDIWGRLCANIFNRILDECLIKTLYCEIPQIAVKPIAIVKRMGFKKTGYIPKALPYTNSRGETKMYDLHIFVHQKEN